MLSVVTHRFLTTVVILLIGTRVFAYHIIGGEMYYDRLDGNNFLITLKLYRDCSNPEAAPFDNPLQIYVYNASHILVDSLVIPFPGSTNLDPDASNPCMSDVPSLCVQEAVYTGTINLPPAEGGYDLVYQRCCRNSTILNIVAPDQSGATYTEHIPDPGSLINSSPRFNNFPPILICSAFPFTFDHSATDPDGDELEYEFFAPYLGADYIDPDPSPDLPPPYAHVIYQAPYSASYPIQSSPAFAIDPVTGQLTGTPTELGQYVVGIAVNEYRDGVLIGTHYRDFQFNITDCSPTIVASLPDEFNNCSDYTVHFTNDSYGTSDFYWDFGVPGITTDVSTAETPTFTYPDTGTYTVTLIAFPGETCSDTAYATVHIYPQLIAAASFVNGCENTAISFTDNSTTDHGEIVHWHWDFGDGATSSLQNPTHTFNHSGTYPVSLEVTNDVGCTDDYASEVTIYPQPDVRFTVDSACLGITGTITNTSIIDPGFTIDSIGWDLEPGGLHPSGNAFTYYFDSTGIYTVTLYATSNLGCTDSFTDHIFIHDPLIAQAQGDTTICEGDTVQLFARNGTDYLWFPDTYISDASIFDPYAYPADSTVYGVIVSDACSADTAWVSVNVLPAPDLNAGPDTSVYRNETVQLYAEDAETYFWSPQQGLSDPEIPDPVATPWNSTAYIVTGIGADGCPSTDTVYVNVWLRCQRYVMPNAFSPNGDGNNDLFRPAGASDDQLLDLSIYNRWGERIFHTTDMQYGWDGKDLNGMPQEIGTYVYTMQTVCDGTRQSLHGIVTLLR